MYVVHIYFHQASFMPIISEKVVSAAPKPECSCHASKEKELPLYSVSIELVVEKASTDPCQVGNSRGQQKAQDARL
jgi:hypothetical protein